MNRGDYPDFIYTEMDGDYTVQQLVGEATGPIKALANILWTAGEPINAARDSGEASYSNVAEVLFALTHYSEWAIRQMVEEGNGTLRTKSTARRAG